MLRGFNCAAILANTPSLKFLDRRNNRPIGVDSHLTRTAPILSRHYQPAFKQLKRWHSHVGTKFLQGCKFPKTGKSWYREILTPTEADTNSMDVKLYVKLGFVKNNLRLSCFPLFAGRSVAGTATCTRSTLDSRCFSWYQDKALSI